MADHAYFSASYLAPTTQFSANYDSHHDDGSDNIKFHDPNDHRSEAPFPAIALGLRLGGGVSG